MKFFKIGFAGSPLYAQKILKSLLKEDGNNYSIDLILSQPSKKSGRGLKLIQTPVSILGNKNNIPVFTPNSFSSISQEIKNRIQSLDLLIVVAYGLILPSSILNMPRYGCLNIHPSLLPRWRGAAPIQRALEAGDEETGVCLIKMNTKLDSGPIWKSEKILIHEKDNYETLETKLINVSIKLITNFIKKEDCGSKNNLNEQNIVGITKAPKILKSECRIDWFKDAHTIRNKVRALSPYPGVFTYFGTTRVKLSDVTVVELKSTNSEPGHIQGLIKDDSGNEYLKVLCSVGAIGIKKLKKEGGNLISSRDFLNSINLKKNFFFI